MQTVVFFPLCVNFVYKNQQCTRSMTALNCQNMTYDNIHYICPNLFINLPTKQLTYQKKKTFVCVLFSIKLQFKLIYIANLPRSIDKITLSEAIEHLSAQRECVKCGECEWKFIEKHIYNKLRFDKCTVYPLYCVYFSKNYFLHAIVHLVQC